jgi:peptide/nickel transport system substrate-binding protein
VKFGWEPIQFREALLGARGVAPLISGVETPDPQTVVFHWPTTSFRAGDHGPREYQVLPRHLLEEALYADPATFPSNPYFYDSSVFVGSGPFRPIEWERGSHLVLEAFDGYYFGRPKVDRVVLRIIADSRTALATMLAGEADMAFRGMGYNEAVVLRDEWAKNNRGSVVFQPVQYAALVGQFRPEVVYPRIC